MWLRHGLIWPKIRLKMGYVKLDKGGDIRRTFPQLGLYFSYQGMV